MPWIVGLDEAGYGPNLGPLVQAAVAARVPAGVECLWTCLARGVRRAADPDDGRLLIDDSKLVYAGPNGLARLERGVSAVAGDAPVGDLMTRVACGSSLADLAGESWYHAAEPRPVACDPAEADPATVRCAQALAEGGVEFRSVRAMVT